MGIHIYVPAEDVWSYFQQNRKELEKEMVAVAENEYTSYAVYLTEDQGLPMFFVCKGECDPEYEEGAVTKNDCIKTMQRLVARYLLPVMVVDEELEGESEEPEDNEEDSYILTRQDAEDEQYAREDELRFALCDFLGTALQIGDGSDFLNEFGEDAVSEILEDILERLALDYGFEIYRPTVTYDEDIGADVFVEYPYNDNADDCIVLNDGGPYEDEGGGLP